MLEWKAECKLKRSAKLSKFNWTANNDLCAHSASITFSNTFCSY